MPQIRVNTVRQDYFVPFAGDGFSRVTGLDENAFAAKMTVNGANVAVSLIADDGNDPASGEIKVKEADGAGTYVISYLPETVGELLVVMEYAAGSLRFGIEHDVVQQTTTDAAASEKIVLKTQYPNGAAAPYCAYDIKDSNGNRIRTGFTDNGGSADLFLPAANGYKAQISRAEMQFDEKTFNVVAGSNPDLEIKGGTPPIILVAS